MDKYIPLLKHLSNQIDFITNSFKRFTAQSAQSKVSCPFKRRVFQWLKLHETLGGSYYYEYLQTIVPGTPWLTQLNIIMHPEILRKVLVLSQVEWRQKMCHKLWLTMKRFAYVMLSPMSDLLIITWDFHVLKEHYRFGKQKNLSIKITDLHKTYIV